MERKIDKELIRIVIACGLFAAVFLLDKIFELYTVFPGRAGWVFPFVCYFLVYLILGFDIIKNAFTNIFKGEFFDENFLMMIASFGAFALGIYNGCLGAETEGFEEGCAVVVFYSIGEYFQEWAQRRSNKKIENLAAESKERVSAEEIENIKLEDMKAGSFITRFARIYTPVVVGLAVIIAIALPLYGIFSGWDSVTCADSYTDYRWTTWIYRGLNFLVVSCPCALVISIPLAFFTGIAAAGRFEILLKGANCLELIAKHKKDELIIIGGNDNAAEMLKNADVAVSVGDIRPEYADMAVNMAFIKSENDMPLLKKIAGRTMRIIRENIVFTIGIKVAVLVLSAFGITNMWFAVFADVGALMIAVLNSLRVGLVRK